MKTATLTLNGKTYEVQLTDEQAQELTAPKKVTGFERVKDGQQSIIPSLLIGINVMTNIIFIMITKNQE